MTKRRLLITTLLFFTVSITIIFVVDQMKYTTVEAVMLEMLGDKEVVNKITIEKKSRENMSFTTDNKQVINKLVEGSSDMVLKKKRETPRVDYFIDIYTNNSTVTVFLGKDNLHIWGTNYKTEQYKEGGQYKIVGNNELYQLVETLELK